MPDRHAGPRLRGRRDECGALDRLLDEVQAGRSQVLVLRGEAGVGKTALLDYLQERASGCLVVRAAGIESEMEVAFAGLHQLCSPMLSSLARLPGPQRDALSTAFGVSAGAAPDRFLVGLAVLGLMSEAAEGQPLVCLVDDAHWLDRASTGALTFVARRLLAESVAVVFAVREPSEHQELAALPELVVGGLGVADARALLDSVVPGRLDERVRDRIVAETRGNPLALVELSRGLTAAELAGGFGHPDARSMPSSIEQSFRRQLESLPTETQQLLLTAAAEPVGDATLLWRAAERLGIGAEAGAPAEATGLIEFGARVRFRHPLVRAIAYRAAAPPDRREVHRALAEATDPGTDPDRRAWHRAHAAMAPDEEVAGELECSAGRAQARGGLAAAGAFLERAGELTPEPGNRARRALDAAQAKLQAGAFDSARALLAMAEEGPEDAFRRARIDLVRAQIAFASSHGGEAASLLLAAAQSFERLDIGSARATYLEAFEAAMFAGRLAGGIGAHDVARAARRAAQPPEPMTSDLLLDGMCVLFTEGYAAAMPLLRSTLQALCTEDPSGHEDRRWLWFASAIAAGLWDDESWHVIATRYVQSARESGALNDLLLALNVRLLLHLFAGELAAAAALVDEIEVVREATGTNLAPYHALGLAAWRGHDGEAEAAIAASRDAVVARGEGTGLSVTQWAEALLYNGLGRYEDAVAAARQAADAELGVANWGLAELVEAAARSDRRELAVEALDQLAEMARVSGTDWALGVEARSRALVTDGDAAEPLHREAIERLDRTRVRAELGRAHLFYGEWLRRAQRRLDAREHLRTAHDMFRRFGAAAFAERARRELQATGETVRVRSVETRSVLTVQEAQVARLAAEGHTNPEIGAQLFISPRTAEYHLHKVFSKLAIGSRRQLRSRLAQLETRTA
jgi:DNA-binding CsgD family transcriptional regulator